jgi:hypothetical protein
MPCSPNQAFSAIPMDARFEAASAVIARCCMRRRLGIEIAAITPTSASTITSSKSVKPRAARSRRRIEIRSFVS